MRSNGGKKSENSDRFSQIEGSRAVRKRQIAREMKFFDKLEPRTRAIASHLLVSLSAELIRGMADKVELESALQQATACENEWWQQWLTASPHCDGMRKP